jgi:cell division transport system ATP-binding protein
MIYFDKVTKEYNGGVIAIDNVTFSVKQGEFMSLVGHSGAGKTTLLKLLLAEETPTSGGVFFESININLLKKRLLHNYRRKIGAIFQDFRLLPQKTAYENIAFAMEAAGKHDDEIEANVPEVLELVGLGDKLWNFPSELSGGERQRVAIARAIINQPEVIIADEPTGNLDPINTNEVIEILKKINDAGTTVILATHNKGVIDLLGKRVVTMDKGRIVRDDKEGRYAL